jgi:hypothetical protein
MHEALPTMLTMSETDNSVEATARPRTWGKRWIRRPWLVAGCLFAASLAVSCALSFAHWPQPATHDEFAYLLAGDTFAQGRLTNPTHPMWQHFESFHIIHRPSYASKYPPGQGAALALGQVFFGHPMVGVWLQTAVATILTYWVLRAWTGPWWSLLGGVLWIAHPAFQLAWGQTYWGGTLAYIGGCLVVGAALRLRNRTRAIDSIAMACGSIVLATTRPFEGFLFCAAVGVWIASRWIVRGFPPLRDLALKFAVPQAVIITAGIFGILAYNAAVTGDPLTMPYAIHEREYGQCPLFIGQEAAHPVYRHERMERFHSGWAMAWYHWQSTLRGLLYTKYGVTMINIKFFLPLGLAAGILLTRPGRWRRLRPILAIAATAYVLSLVSVWNHPHYSAAIVPLLIIAAVSGLRRADILGRRWVPGLRLGTGMVALQLFLFAWLAVRHGSRPYAGWWDVRAAVIKKLNELPGQDLILVRYGDRHDTLAEWVYNDADIDAAPIVWARSMDEASHEELLRYFGDRTVWLLEPDKEALHALPRDPDQQLAALSQGS